MYTAEEKVGGEKDFIFFPLTADGQNIIFGMRNASGDYPIEIQKYLDRSEVIELIEKLKKILHNLPQ